MNASTNIPLADGSPEPSPPHTSDRPPPGTSTLFPTREDLHSPPNDTSWTQKPASEQLAATTNMQRCMCAHPCVTASFGLSYQTMNPPVHVTHFKGQTDDLRRVWPEQWDSAPDRVVNVPDCRSTQSTLRRKRATISMTGFAIQNGHLSISVLKIHATRKLLRTATSAFPGDLGEVARHEPPLKSISCIADLPELRCDFSSEIPADNQMIFPLKCDPCNTREGRRK